MRRGNPAHFIFMAFVPFRTDAILFLTPCAAPAKKRRAVLQQGAFYFHQNREQAIVFIVRNQPAPLPSSG